MTLKHFIGPSDPLLRSSFSEEMKTVVEGLKSVSDKYGISLTTKSGTNRLIKRLGKFKSLNEYDVVFFVQASEILGTNGQATIAVVSVNSTVIHAGSKTQRREALTEWEFIGIAQLHQDFGQVYMRPELLGDKINELFNPVEVDFDFDKEFSKKYFVVTADETKLRECVTPSLLSAIKRHNDLEIEIQGRDLLVRQKKRVSTESAETISQFLFELTKKK
jgi:hypothetical protein